MTCMFASISITWNLKKLFIKGCFNWMIPNLYTGEILVSLNISRQFFVAFLGWLSRLSGPFKSYLTSNKGVKLGHGLNHADKNCLPFLP